MATFPKDRAELEKRIRAGWRPKFVYFWSHEPARNGALGSECFSQWYRAPFVIDGITFPTAEHAMMWGKAKLFGDEESATTILGAKSPAAAKRFGRGVRGFTDAKWNAHRMDIVLSASLAKFGQNPTLRQYIVGTGERVLVEASAVDRIWGIGLEAKDERASNPLLWRGENLLGFALMQARAQLAAV